MELPLATAPLTVNLMALTDTNAAILINEAVIEPGTYEWLAMDIAAERGPRDSYVLTEAGGEEEIELRVPSGRVRLVSGFEVPRIRPCACCSIGTCAKVSSTRPVNGSTS